MKNAIILEMAGNIAKSSKFQHWALFLGKVHGLIIGFELYHKNVMFKIERYF